jgi:hypothetical protein
MRQAAADDIPKFHKMLKNVKTIEFHYHIWNHHDKRQFFWDSKPIILIVKKHPFYVFLFRAKAPLLRILFFEHDIQLVIQVPPPPET